MAERGCSDMSQECREVGAVHSLGYQVESSGKRTRGSRGVEEAVSPMLN